MESVTILRNKLEDGIKEIVPAAKINGHVKKRSPNTLNVTIPGIRGESIVLALDRMGISLSSGSACRSGSPEPSHTLKAMGLSDEEAHCSLRFSLGINNNSKEIDKTLKSIKEIIKNGESFVRFIPCR